MYTDEKTTLVLIAMLKEYGISNVVMSPGTRNSGFAASLQSDPFFNVYSVVDERSASYFATGLAFETQKPVVISCTGATASRNYLSALTEAYYRNLPIIAITFAHETGNSYNYVQQHLDRSVSQNDIKLCSIELPKVVDEKTQRECELLLNVAFTKASCGRKGPVHIDIKYLGNKFNIPSLPTVKRTIYTETEDFVEDRNLISTLTTEVFDKKIAVFIGEHREMDSELTNSISEIATKFRAPVFVDHTSNYYGANKVLIGQISDICLTENVPDIIIDIGGICGQYSLSRLFKKADVWRVSNMHEIRQRAGSVVRYFDCTEKFFFKQITKVEYLSNSSYISEIEDEISNINTDSLPVSGTEALPFSAAFVASKLVKKIPEDAHLHVSILNSLRAINFFNFKHKVTCVCNVGGFGIDGPVSTLFGQAAAKRDKLFFGQIGDLAFFYDMNILANRHVNNNVRIILVNNGQGVEFRINTWLNRELGKDKIEPYISARGHNGSAKEWAECCGFIYMSARSKKEYLDQLNKFCNPDINRFDRPVIFEVFTQAYDEVMSVKALRGKPNKNKS